MKLFESVRIGKLALKNRISMAPMGVGGLVNTDGSLSQQGIDYFVRRAEGGVGLIRVGFTRTNSEFELVKDYLLLKNLVVDNKIHIKWLSALAEAVHAYGAKISIQLSAGVGRIAGRDVQIKGQPIGPSVLDCFWSPHNKTRELCTEDIEKIIGYFHNSAEIVKRAGFDAIEIHGHEGYLIDQFSTGLWNHRTDEYGGSLENRMKFSGRLIKAVKQGAGEDFPVIYRYGLIHELKGGRTIEEGLQIAGILEQAGADALDIDSGCYETWYLPHPPTTMEPAFDIELAAKVKQEVSIPVIASGKLGYPEIAERIIQENKADFVSLGRPLLADPDWVNKVKSKRNDEIRYCIGCHEGCLKRIFEHKHISCAVNPATGNEQRMTVTPAKNTKKVMVIGGGVAGLEAARVCAERGHQVELWEKGNYLGGNFHPDYLPKFKLDYKLYLNYLIKQMQIQSITYHLNKEADINAIKDYQPDVVFVACGSSSVLPDIKGIDKCSYIYAKDLFTKSISISGKVVIIGGGIIGLETALLLAQKQCEVTVLECCASAGSDMFLANKMHLLKLLSDSKVSIICDANITSVEGKNIFYNNTEKIGFDNLVVAAGLRSNDNLAAVLEKEEIKYYSIGDSVKPRKVIDAVWEAYKTARLI